MLQLPNTHINKQASCANCQNVWVRCCQGRIQLKLWLLRRSLTQAAMAGVPLPCSSRGSQSLSEPFHWQGPHWPITCSVPILWWLSSTNKEVLPSVQIRTCLPTAFVRLSCPRAVPLQNKSRTTSDSQFCRQKKKLTVASYLLTQPSLLPVKNFQSLLLSLMYTVITELVAFESEKGRDRS